MLLRFQNYLQFIRAVFQLLQRLPASQQGLRESSLLPSCFVPLQTTSPSLLFPCEHLPACGNKVWDQETKTTVQGNRHPVLQLGWRLSEEELAQLCEIEWVSGTEKSPDFCFIIFLHSVNHWQQGEN